jgi:HK97 gp10 family phage protein
MPAFLKSRFPSIIAQLPARADESVEQAAQAVADAARERVPVDTGTLRDSIHVIQQGDDYVVVAGNNKAFYGHMVEHGTSHSGAHPFLIPALEQVRAQIEARIRAGMSGL